MHFSHAASLVCAAIAMVSMGAEAQPIVNPQCLAEMEWGIDYIGNDIDRAASTDPKGCCAICAARWDCRAFSWSDFNGGTCWLKSGKGATKAAKNVHSGVASRDPPPPPVGQCGKFEENTDYPGNDIGNVWSGKAEGCCDICKNRQGCAAFSWTDFNGGTCWLKSTKGKPVTKQGARSSALGQQPASSCSTIEENIDYTGNDVGRAPSVTAEGCCAICSSTANCGAYSWSTHEGGTCWLKSFKGFTSVKNGVRSSVLNGGTCQFFKDGDIPGNELATVPAKTFAECCPICQKRSGCKFFAWNTQNGGQCYLKTAKGNSVSKPGTVWGSV